MANVNFKICDVTTWETSKSNKHIAQYLISITLCPISIFRQLIEYNIGNIFVEKSYTKCGGGTIPRPFSKNQNWVCLWIDSLKF